MPCKILLIEDDLLLREEIKLLLENAGYQAAEIGRASCRERV